MRKFKNFSKRFAICSAIGAFIFIIGVGVLFQTQRSNGSNREIITTGTVDDLKNSVSEAENYVRSKYSGKDSLSITYKSSKFVDTINISRATLNSAYNSANGTSYSGTCSEVAITILTVMYANSDNPDKNAMFRDVLNYAISKKYFSIRDNGTYSADLDTLTNYALSLYQSSKNRKASDAYWDVYDTLRSNADNGKLTMFNITGHSMVGAGYYEFNVSWKEDTYFLWWKTGTKTVTETAKFAIVNQGWADANPGGVRDTNDIGRYKTYQLYPSDKIGGDFFSCLFGTSAYFNVVIK